MEFLVPILTIAAAIALAAMSPGPSFIMVARTALAVSRRSGLGAALGMGLGAALFATLGLLGLHTLLNTVPTLYWGLKLAGGAYLIYLGWRIFRAARLPLELDVAARQGDLPPRFWAHCGLGFFTQISNPKTAVVYASIFVSLLPREINLALGVLLVGMIFVIEGGWYAIVALALSAERSRTTYLGWKTSIDRLAGGVMAALGIKLLGERV